MLEAVMRRIEGLEGEFCENPTRRLVLLVSAELTLVDSYVREAFEPDGLLLRAGPFRHRRRLSGDVRIEKDTLAAVVPGHEPTQLLPLSIHETDVGADDEGLVDIGWLYLSIGVGVALRPIAAHRAARRFCVVEGVIS